MSLKDIFCQDRVIGILQQAYGADRVPHAYIFAGLEGVGKFTTARQWAKLLLCNEPLVEGGFADSCGLCESCRLFEAGSHPDFNNVYKELREFTRDGKGKPPPVDVPIDVIREFVIEKVSTKPTLSARKVFVVGEAEKLNASSQNALLKVLEEPPGYCCIILLCTRMEKLLATTKSRCQIVRFWPVAEERIIEKLREMGMAGDQPQYWARLARGSLGLACQWARLELAGANLYEIKQNVIKSISSSEYARALELAQWLVDKSKKIASAWAEMDNKTSKTDITRRAHKSLIHIIISALHDAMMLHLEGTPALINSDQQECIKKIAAGLDAEQSAEKIEECYKTMRFIESSVNEKLIFERLLLSLPGFDRIRL